MNVKAPPRAARWILERIHSDKGFFTHLGDFEEAFSEIQQENGTTIAFFWYWMQVFRSLPGFIKNKLYWSAIMLKNYFTISLRTLFKNKWISLINISGLAVGLACFILILAYVRHEFSYDRFFEKADRIYRVLVGDKFGREAMEYNDTNPELLAPLIKSEFPEIINSTRIFKSSSTERAVMQKEDKVFYADGVYADENFLNILTYPLVSGFRTEALKGPNTVVLTESLAQKLFGSEDPLGQTLAYREKYRTYDVKVTGVIEDLPEATHLKFDYLLSMETLRSDKRNSYMFNTWEVWNFQTYVELIPNTTKGAVEAKIPPFIKNYFSDKNLSTDDVNVILQPITDIHLRSQIRGDRATNNEIRYVYLFGSIAVIILLIACINYMNLTSARAAVRAKEIGIRKVTGANHTQIFFQFMGESIFITLVAAGFALALIHLFLPRFRTLISTDLHINYLRNPSLLVIILGAVVLTGILSGIYPATVLSSFRPVKVMKGHTSSGKKGSFFRNVLVVFQFCATIILLVGTLVIFKQMHFIKSERLGFDREHVVIIPIREEETRKKANLLKTEFLKLPEVQNVSLTSGLPTDIRSHLYGTKFQTDQGETITMDFFFDYVDHDFVDVFKLEILEGRNFSKEHQDDDSCLLVNEAFVKKLGWVEPTAKEFKSMGKNRKIVGVIKDFHFATLHSEIQPMALVLGGGNKLAVRIHPGDVSQIVGVLKNVFDKNTSSQPFDFTFVDDEYNRLYRKEQRIGDIFGTFSILAVFIACLGLLGLSSFIVERKTKEIGIRKILGASEIRIVNLLTKDFLKLILIANVLAWPVAYFVMRSWLQDFAYRIGLNAWIFFLAAGAALVIAVLTISSQTLRAALSNPSDALRYE
jgi:putative ABC transport system permease protein